MRADLHCHTKISDGSMGISELLMVAARLKIKYISITDHDTMGGVSRAAIVGDRIGVTVIPGVELSAYDEQHGKRVHLLCYLPDSPDRMEGYFKRMADKRREIAEQQIQQICQKLPITPQMVASHAQGCTTIFKAHIMHTLMDCGYANEIYGALYRSLFGKGKPADIPCDYDPYPEVLKLIKSAGGIAVLAHPGLYDNFDIVGDLIENGLDGIELVHPRNSEEDREKIRKIAAENGLLTTGGSDFHGMYETPVRPLGDCCVTEAEVAALVRCKEQKKKV